MTSEEEDSPDLFAGSIAPASLAMPVCRCNSLDELAEGPLPACGSDNDAVSFERDVDIAVFAELRLRRECLGNSDCEAVAPSLDRCHHIAPRCVGFGVGIYNRYTRDKAEMQHHSFSGTIKKPPERTGVSKLPLDPRGNRSEPNVAHVARDVDSGARPVFVAGGTDRHVVGARAFPRAIQDEYGGRVDVD